MREQQVNSKAFVKLVIHLVNDWVRVPGIICALGSCLKTKHHSLVFFLTKSILKILLQRTQLNLKLAKAAFKIRQFIEYQVLYNGEPITLCLAHLFNFGKPNVEYFNSVSKVRCLKCNRWIFAAKWYPFVWVGWLGSWKLI